MTISVVKALSRGGNPVSWRTAPDSRPESNPYVSAVCEATARRRRAPCPGSPGRRGSIPAIRSCSINGTSY